MSKNNIVTAASDVAANLVGAFPKSVKAAHEFENYNEYLNANRPSTKQLEDERTTPLNPAPLISVAMVCVGESDSKMDATLVSLLAQTYTNWELCIAFELSKTGLERFNSLEKIRIVLSDGTDKELIALAQEQLRGAYFLMLSPGDRLAPDAMYSVAQAMLANRQAEVFYMDEDSVTDEGERHSPIFKPDYGPDTMLSYNMTGKPLFVAKRVHEKVGGYIGTGKNDLWEYTIKCMRAAKGVVHIARVGLSTPEEGSNRNMNLHDMRKRLDTILSERKPVGNSFAGEIENTCRIRYPKKKQPSVGIVIPNVDDANLLARCIESIEQQSNSDCIRIFVADNGQEGETKQNYLRALKRNKVATLVEVEASSSMPRILNDCAKQAISDVLLFLNGSSEILSPGFPEQLTELVLRKDTGAVGGKILDAGGNILSVGTVIGLGGWAGSPYTGTPDDEEDWLKCTFTKVQRNVSAVSGAFMAIGGETFFNSGLFDETITGVGWDTELCIRLMRRGLYNCFTPYAVVRLNGTLPDYAKASAGNLTRCYDAYRQTLLAGDKYYNFNFDPASSVPMLAVNPYPPITLNQNYKG
ncbi:MAG: glycosyltransferase [Christensenellaceae bacterium]|nr:glycosyltransferase [Christensenellaceae bacterium]